MHHHTMIFLERMCQGQFGEIGITKKGPRIISKMTNPGVSVLCLGHADDHAGDAKHLLDLETKKAVFSCDRQ